MRYALPSLRCVETRCPTYACYMSALRLLHLEMYDKSASGPFRVEVNGKTIYLRNINKGEFRENTAIRFFWFGFSVF
jgi:hypothetical protein